MFQTEPILWLWTLGSPAITWLMWAVSQLGYTPVYTGLVLLLAFGFRLRPALGVLLALLLAGLGTDALKTTLALPRPVDVDERLSRPSDGSQGRTSAPAGATTFWSLPPPRTLAAVRSQPEASFGMPSGHVSSAMAFVLGAVVFFQERRLIGLVVAWPLLMGLSRMYLGRHFLADVLAGLAVGGLAVLAASLFLGETGSSPGPHGRVTRAKPHWPLLSLAVTALALAALAPFAPMVDPENAGRLLGFTGALVVLVAAGFPEDRGSPACRAGRVTMAAVVYVASSEILGALLDTSGWDESRVATLAAAALITAATLLGGVAIARHLRWYGAAGGHGEQGAAPAGPGRDPFAGIPTAPRR